MQTKDSRDADAGPCPALRCVIASKRWTSIISDSLGSVATDIEAQIKIRIQKPVPRIGDLDVIKGNLLSRLATSGNLPLHQQLCKRLRWCSRALNAQVIEIKPKSSSRLCAMSRALL